MTNLFDALFDKSCELILQNLPEDHEIDDISWNDEEEIFQIPVFDVSQFPGRMVDRFRFYRLPGETDEELSNRWQEEINAFNSSWSC